MNRAALSLSLFITGCLSGASPLRFDDVPPAAMPFLPGIGDAAAFEQFRQKLVRDMNDRLQSGEQDALIYYVLQGRRFTKEQSIEPVLSAREFSENKEVPASVSARIHDFVRACKDAGPDERLQYFCGVTGHPERLAAEYQRAMRFLYDKEFRAREREGGERRDFVASLYRSRGLSSDSGMDANFPVYLALKKLAANRALRLDKILIIGPGLDFAPRTGLDDSVPPQSLQPFAVADAILQLGLSSSQRLRIHCVDINPHVVEHLRLARSTIPIITVPNRSGPTVEYTSYYKEFGRAIGQFSGVAGLITADRLDIVSERYDPSPGYDLVVATNVLVYLSDPELALAMVNIQSMLRDGGYFVHNESRDCVEPIGRAVKMPIVDAKLIRLFENDRRAIYDTQVVHRKGPK